MRIFSSFLVLFAFLPAIPALASENGERFILVFRNSEYSDVSSMVKLLDLAKSNGCKVSGDEGIAFEQISMFGGAIKSVLVTEEKESESRSFSNLAIGGDYNTKQFSLKISVQYPDSTKGVFSVHDCLAKALLSEY